MTNDKVGPRIFGAAIKSRREVLGLEQAKLARLMGWSRQRLCDLEAGRHAAPVQRDIHTVLAAALRWPLTKVRELVMLERGELRLDVDSLEKQHVARMIVGMWDDLTPELREKIEELVQPATQAAHQRIAALPLTESSSVYEVEEEPNASRVQTEDLDSE